MLRVPVFRETPPPTHEAKSEWQIPSLPQQPSVLERPHPHSYQRFILCNMGIDSHKVDRLKFVSGTLNTLRPPYHPYNPNYRLFLEGPPP